MVGMESTKLVCHYSDEVDWERVFSYRKNAGLASFSRALTGPGCKNMLQERTGRDSLQEQLKIAA